MSMTHTPYKFDEDGSYTPCVTTIEYQGNTIVIDQQFVETLETAMKKYGQDGDGLGEFLELHKP